MVARQAAALDFNLKGRFLFYLIFFFLFSTSAVLIRGFLLGQESAPAAPALGAHKHTPAECFYMSESHLFPLTAGLMDAYVCNRKAVNL